MRRLASATAARIATSAIVLGLLSASVAPAARNKPAIEELVEPCRGAMRVAHETGSSDPVRVYLNAVRADPELDPADLACSAYLLGVADERDGLFAS